MFYIISNPTAINDNRERVDSVALIKKLSPLKMLIRNLI